MIRSEAREEENLALVKSWMGTIPMDLDILIMDEIGKNISGAGDILADFVHDQDVEIHRDGAHPALDQRQVLLLARFRSDHGRNRQEYLRRRRYSCRFRP